MIVSMTLALRGADSRARTALEELARRVRWRRTTIAGAERIVADERGRALRIERYER
ncbi:MAG: hypothetical protein V4550_20025 [Gemmatimonadota bacterium]